jgi:outer membrane lipoprotein-sorting protein
MNIRGEAADRPIPWINRCGNRHAMHRGLRWALVSVFLVAFVGLGSAQIQPEALDVLKKVGDTYGSVSQYRLEFDAMPDGSESKSASTRIALRPAGKYRLETIMEPRAVGDDDSSPLSAVFVFDGSRYWGYNPARNVYTVSRMKDLPLDIDKAFGIAEFRDLLGSYSRQGGTSIRILKEDRVTVGGRLRDCWVVELAFPVGSEQLWIEKGTYYVLRVDAGEASLVYRTIELNKPLPEGLFHFAPPQGARLVDRLSQ